MCFIEYIMSIIKIKIKGMINRYAKAKKKSMENGYCNS